jgi:hypothetical protein
MNKVERRKFLAACRTGNPWAACCALQVRRKCLPVFPMASLEAGVNFFVLALEFMGLRTSYSCQGHPKGFYITFHAGYDVAREIKGAKYFQVEIEGTNYWSLRLNETTGTRRKYSDDDRIRVLSGAARNWVAYFNFNSPAWMTEPTTKPCQKQS